VVEIADNDTLSVVVCDGIATVSWHVESCVNSSKDRVCLFRENCFNPLSPLAVQQTHSNKPDGVAKFVLKGISQGKYEFCFISNGTSHPLKKSHVFTV
jgi:hypothetical protein